MRTCIVYSSCTGNTRKVAEAMAEASGLPCCALRHDPDPQDYDLLAVGFWVRKGLPDARPQRYIQSIQDKNNITFGTLGA